MSKQQKVVKTSDVKSQRQETSTSERWRGKVQVKSSDIQVGDLIIVEKNQRIPADMIFLRTSEKTAVDKELLNAFSGISVHRVAGLHCVTQRRSRHAGLILSEVCIVPQT
ncbi:hypothetical protein INR49_006677 [Caranx melampygus]|nr:hypothetical protein INR49_006677 [Caranx melampygus]